MIEGLLVKLFAIVLVMGTADLAFLIWLNFRKAHEDRQQEKDFYQDGGPIREAVIIRKISKNAAKKIKSSAVIESDEIEPSLF